MISTASFQPNHTEKNNQIWTPSSKKQTTELRNIHMSWHESRSNTEMNNRLPRTSYQKMIQFGVRSFALPLYCIPQSLMHCSTTAACFNACWPPAYCTISSAHPPITSGDCPSKKDQEATPAVVICNCQSPHPPTPTTLHTPMNTRTHTHTLFRLYRAWGIYECRCSFSCKTVNHAKGRL